MNNYTGHRKVRFNDLAKAAKEAPHEQKLGHKHEKSQRASNARLEESSKAKADIESTNIAQLRLVPSVPEAVEVTADSNGRIREAMSLGLEADKSLADLRAILVGPMQQLHDARVEEFVSILEENDQANKTANNIITNRVTKISEMCDRLIGSSEDNFRKIQKQAVHFDSELQKMSEVQLLGLHRQDQKLDAHSTAMIKRLEEMTAEFGRLYDELSRKSANDIYRLENDVMARLQVLTAAHVDAEMLSKQLEAKLVAVEAQNEKLNRRNAEVFCQGFSDLAERFLNVSETPTR